MWMSILDVFCSLITPMMWRRDPSILSHSPKWDWHPQISMTGKNAFKWTSDKDEWGLRQLLINTALLEIYWCCLIDCEVLVKIEDPQMDGYISLTFKSTFAKASHSPVGASLKARDLRGAKDLVQAQWTWFWCHGLYMHACIHTHIHT